MTNEEEAAEQRQRILKRTVKDSVFRNLFGQRKYLFQLYKALHPEDTESKEDDLTYETLENVATNDIYNDLGFRVGNKLLILVEHQSTWTVNIIIRCIMYLLQILKEYFIATKQSLYSSTPVTFPEPELYVVYTGPDKVPNSLKFSEIYFGGKQTALEVKVKVITDSQEGDILNQYVTFTKVLNEQVKHYGRSREAIMETIRICSNNDILKEYLKSMEKEVVDIMMTLFDQETVLNEYLRSERLKHQAEDEARGAAEERERSRFRMYALISRMPAERSEELKEALGSRDNGPLNELYKEFGIIPNTVHPRQVSIRRMRRRSKG